MNFRAHIGRLFALTAIVIAAGTLRAQPERRIIPRHPAAIQLPEVGRTVFPDSPCYGITDIYPLPDCNSDGIGDVLVRVARCDTTILGETPNEIIVLYGQEGSVPTFEAIYRLPVQEIGTSQRFLTVGDWNNDGSPDLLTTIHIFGDSTQTDRPGGVSSYDAIVWWGNPSGRYSVGDTSRMSNSHEGWALPAAGISRDYNHDSIDDLWLFRPGYYIDAVSPNSATFEFHGDVQIFYGSDTRRWSSDRLMQPDWVWYDAPTTDKHWSPFVRRQWVDQNGDGLLDLAWFEEGRANKNGTIWMIYGTEGEVLDTANIVELPLDSAWGKYALFSDITGDNVPELLLNTGGQEAIKAFVGFKGQRLPEQYGSGNEPPHPGEEHWWGKPWAVVPLPGQLHDGWAASGWSPIYDNGDVDLDGIDDISVASAPDVIVYKTGQVLDSLYDGWFGGIEGGCNSTCGAVFKNNVDGTGRTWYGSGVLCGGVPAIVFWSASDGLAQTGRYRKLPPGTGKPDSDVESTSTIRGDSPFHLQATPNPATGIVELRWIDPALAPTTITVTDVLGQTVTTLHAAAGSTRCQWNASHTFGGRYYITIVAGNESETTTVLVGF